MNEKINKILVIVEFLGLLVAGILLAIFKYIPEYKASLGSSDVFIDYDKCIGIMELNITNGPDFMVIINNDNKVSNIVFLEEKSLCLYNKEIENTKYSVATKKITDILQEDNYISTNTIIEISNYKDYDNYSEFLDNIKSYTNIQVIEKERTLEERLSFLNISGKTEKDLVERLDMYSKNIARSKKNIASSITKDISKETALEYANTIYDKLEQYALNIENQSKDSDILPIQLLATGLNSNVYASKDSWYYIENHKVYAYINFNSATYRYDFCYYGSKEDLKEKKCQ